MPSREGAHGKVVLTLDGSLAELRLSNPEKRNCFSLELTQDLCELTAQAVERDETRAIVVTADGPIFCAGADRHLMESDSEKERIQMLEQYNRAYELLQSKPIPVIVGAKGAAIGAGASFLCWIADLRIVSDDIEIWWAGGNYGLVPLELATYLKNEIGTPLALELMLLGKHRTLTAPEAKTIGLVNRITPAEEVDNEARRIAGLVTEIDASHNVSKPLLTILRSAEAEQIGETIEEAQQKQSIGQTSLVRD